MSKLSDTEITALTGRFLAWPLPKSVRSDLCVTEECAYPRSGTNLLTAAEARQMIEFLFAEAGPNTFDECPECGDRHLASFHRPPES